MNHDQPKGLDGKFTNRDRCDECNCIIYDFWEFDDDGNMLCPDCLEKAMAEDRQHCVDEGRHLRRLVPSGGYDVCFNCGNKE